MEYEFRKYDYIVCDGEMVQVGVEWASPSKFAVILHVISIEVFLQEYSA